METEGDANKEKRDDYARLFMLDSDHQSDARCDTIPNSVCLIN